VDIAVAAVGVDENERWHPRKRRRRQGRRVRGAPAVAGGRRHPGL